MLTPYQERQRAIVELFITAEKPGVVDWLEGNIRMPRKVSPRSPGPFSTARLPIVRPILECWHPGSGVNDCDVAAATQLMKTTILIMGSCYRMPHEPMPELVVVPTKKFASEVMGERRFHPLIMENPALAALMPVNPDMFRKSSMDMLGGELTLVGSNSPTELSGRPCGIVAQDEVCKFEHRTIEDAPEAHPMDLADERTKDFGELAFRYKSSSPNVETHPFWQHWEMGDQTVFDVPCPNCGEGFNFDFVQDKDTGYKSLVWDQSARHDVTGVWDEGKVRESAHYVCPKCEFPIRDEHKMRMVDGFQERRMNPGASRRHRSFQVPSFYSPRVTFGEMAWQFLGGQDLFGLQNYFNSWLARPWSEIELQVKDEDVKRLISQEYRRGFVPYEPDYLVATGDPGETSGQHWVVAASMPNEDIYVIDWGKALGLSDLISDGFKTQMTGKYKLLNSAKVLPVSSGLVDSNFETTDVFDMCYASKGFWSPTLGSDAKVGTYQEHVVRTHPALTRFVFSDYQLKNELYDQRMKRGEGPRIFLPADADQMLIGQLSGQQRVSDKGMSGGKRWKRVANDHLGDCLKQVVLHQWIVAAARRLGGG